MKRRTFLRSSSMVSIPLLLNGLPLSAIGQNALFNVIEEDNDHVLVLIQMNGGNDGLNTIIPVDKYDILANVRSNVVVPSSKIIEVESAIGFHPSMMGVKELYDNGKMTIVQDVGYPNQNRSHFRSSDIWTSGSPADEFWTTGWLGRYFDNRFTDYPEGYPNNEYPDPFALTIGSGVSETCQGSITNFSLALSDPLSISTLVSGGVDDVPDSPYGRELSFLRTTIEQANAYGEIITNAAQKGNNLSSLYDDDMDLAQQLKAIALLISGGLKTKVYIANIGGFDTHANQVEGGDTTMGNHAALLQNVSESVAAFQDDLSLLGLEEKVITMTFSEFGRRIRSNDSLGTDHGTAAPMMIFGNCINPGVIGSNPDLPENPTQYDGVAMQFDFRNVYGSVLMDWFGLEETEVKSILFNDFSYLPIIKSCRITTSTHDVSAIEEISITNFPNPFYSWTTIRFESKGEYTRISVYDTLGYEIDVVSDQSYAAGYHDVKYDGSRLNSGNYFYRIITPTGVKTKAFIKI